MAGSLLYLVVLALVLLVVYMIGRIVIAKVTDDKNWVLVFGLVLALIWVLALLDIFIWRSGTFPFYQYPARR